jgi:TRAP-type C4-dicarboxylate transport system permease small subunit
MDRLISYLSRAFMLVGGVALLLLVLLATGNVALRLFRLPFAGTYEIVSFLGALVTAGALAHTQRKKDHIVVDIISEKFPGLLKKLLNGVNYLLTALLFGIAAWQLYVWAEKIRSAGELSETLQIKFHPFIYGVAAGFGLLALVIFLDLLKLLLHKGEEEA